MRGTCLASLLSIQLHSMDTRKQPYAFLIMELMSIPRTTWEARLSPLLLMKAISLSRSWQLGMVILRSQSYSRKRELRWIHKRPTGTALIQASLAGRLEVVGFLLLVGANINHLTVDGISPLYAAAQGGHLSVVKLLVKRGADIYQASDRGCGIPDEQGG